MKKRVLVTGANGMLANSLCPLLADSGHDIIATDIDNAKMDYLDITDSGAVVSLAKKFRPEVIMHLAAITDMDLCQRDPALAYSVNAEGTKNMAYACKEIGAEMVYISTGAVFDGKKSAPYIESDRPNPINIYGKTKLKGELYVREILSEYYIFRVGWMIGGFEKDKKFVAKIIKLLETERELRVVNDRFGSPTCTEDLSRNLLSVVEAALYGTYHMVNRGICTRYDMAERIVNFLGKKDISLTPIRNVDYPSVTPRARTEAMINSELKKKGMDDMVGWEEALISYLEKMKRRNLLF